MIVDVRARAAYLAYRAGADLARVTPPAIGSAMAGTLSRAMTLAWPSRRAQVVRNLTRITDGRLQGAELDRSVDEVFLNYGRYWHEFFRLPEASPAWIQSHHDIEGFEHIQAAVDRGRGGVLALPHLGHWDFAGAYLATRGVPLTVVAELVDPPELFEWFAASRRRLGMEVVALGPRALGTLSRSLAAGRIVCLLCDRDLAGNGVTVEFFGEKTTVPAGPALLACRTGAPLFPCAAYFTANEGHLARVLDPIAVERRDGVRADVERITAELLRDLEDLIRIAPQQWLVMQPNWPSDEL